jgi:hypothetical protein
VSLSLVARLMPRFRQTSRGDTMTTRRLPAVGVVLTAVLSLVLWTSPAPSALAAEGPEAAAQTASDAWLTLVDAAKYAESWKGASTLFRNAVTEDQWKQALTGVRGPLGKVISRKIKSRQYTEHLPGAPDGRYVVLQYDTVFADKASAVETVTLMLDKDDNWRASGYFIK